MAPRRNNWFVAKRTFAQRRPALRDQLDLNQSWIADLLAHAVIALNSSQQR